MSNTTFAFRTTEQNLAQLDGLVTLRKSQGEVGVTRSSEIRRLIRQASREVNLIATPKPKKPKKATPSDDDLAVLRTLAEIWDDTMPRHITRIHRRCKERDAALLLAWKANPDFEKWRNCFRAFAASDWHMESARGPMIHKSLFREKNIGVWLTRGEQLQAVEDDPQSTIDDDLPVGARENFEAGRRAYNER